MWFIANPKPCNKPKKPYIQDGPCQKPQIINTSNIKNIIFEKVTFFGLFITFLSFTRTFSKIWGKGLNTFNNSLGEAPAHTTLTVHYRVGGGIKSNVSSNDLIFSFW